MQNFMGLLLVNLLRFISVLCHRTIGYADPLSQAHPRYSINSEKYTLGFRNPPVAPNAVFRVPGEFRGTRLSSHVVELPKRPVKGVLETWKRIVERDARLSIPVEAQRGRNIGASESVRWKEGRKEGSGYIPRIIMISGSTDDVRRSPRGARPAVDPLLRYLSYSTSRLMHNLLRAFNNANRRAGGCEPLHSGVAGESIFRQPSPHISPMF